MEGMGQLLGDGRPVESLEGKGRAYVEEVEL